MKEDVAAASPSPDPGAPECEAPGAFSHSWILTGMSGAGKATAVAALERAGVSCVDNLPVDLVASWLHGPGREGARVAVVDARQGERLRDLGPLLSSLRVLFLDARDAVLVQRLAESTRPHPCAEAGIGLAAVWAERDLLGDLRAVAEVVVDTSDIDAAELATRVVEVVAPDRALPPFRCSVTSFGFKYGLLLEADWIVDARLLPNPFWDPRLRPLSGLDAPVREAILGDDRGRRFLDRLAQFLSEVCVVASGAGRRHLAIGVGCTGGRHRSVAIAEALGRRLADEGIAVAVRHRDLHREAR